MIWAVDQDDDSFNALKALTGKEVDPLIDESKTLDEFDLSRCVYMDCGEDYCSLGWKMMVCPHFLASVRLPLPVLTYDSDETEPGW